MIPRLSLEVSFITDMTVLLSYYKIVLSTNSTCGGLNNIADWLISVLSVTLKYLRMCKN